MNRKQRRAHEKKMRKWLKQSVADSLFGKDGKIRAEIYLQQLRRVSSDQPGNVGDTTAEAISAKQTE